MFLILCLQSWAWWYWEQCLRSRSPSCIWTSVSRQTHRGRRSSRVYIYVRMSGDRKYRCGRDTWVSNCTTVGTSSTTNSTSCWASVPVYLASDLLWEPTKLAIGVAELCARTTGHGRWVAAACDEGWKCDGHIVTETLHYFRDENKILTTSAMH